jgi:hypothetical protein
VKNLGPAQEEGSDEKEPSGFMVGSAAGGKARITLTWTEDIVAQWEIGCFEQGGVQYDAGMKGTVTVSQ